MADHEDDVQDGLPRKGKYLRDGPRLAEGEALHLSSFNAAQDIAERIEAAVALQHALDADLEWMLHMLHDDTNVNTAAPTSETESLYTDPFGDVR